MACKPCYDTNGGCASHQATKVASFPRPPAPPQPPLLPLPAQAPSRHPFQSQPASRPVSRAKKPRCHDAAPGPRRMPAAAGASAPITAAAPSKKRVAPATGLEVEWTETGSLYSVSPPPSSVPMPTSLLLTVTAPRKPPTACSVEVAGAGVDVSATDELRRLLGL
ncbi:wiskott-Aldrich syndrome protein family member 1-like [Panicum miliaceum]|uniref:Wiskott-Aldrich syndrome protein family member 1-like n=1 Tax=Panicum miliaceum TaxID=4540 RepID=A0A3L6TA16_PANMI|nr:wiskott-Aldrich syndrome protein family member 1-like [Panicum miliaceum]